jgi:hypothetical protein
MFGNLQITPKWSDGTVTDGSTISQDLRISNGTGAGQANAYWQKTLSVAAGASEDIDLRALAVSVFGVTGTLALATVKSLLLRNKSSRTALVVNGTVTDRWTALSAGALTLNAGGVFLASDEATGLATTTTSKVVKVTNNDSSSSLTANTTSGSKVVSGISSTSGLSAGMLVSGTGIASGTTVASVTNSTSIMLDTNATATGTAVSLSFVNPPAELEVVVIGVKA